MKFLIYGGNEKKKKKVIKLLEKDTKSKIFIGKERVDDDESLLKEIQQIIPDRIISLIGRTHGKGFSTIDYLEQKGKLKENIRDNLYSPVLLALICKKMNIHFTYLGTGCIFDYDDIHTTNNGFLETDTPNFFGSSYSTTKGFTDRIMHHIDNVLNLRIRMPITDCHSGRNFIKKITKYDKICSISNSMTVLNDMLPILIDMSKKKTLGTFNLTNPGVISHNEILELYREIVDNDFTWKNFDISSQNKVLLSERSNNYLETNKLLALYPNIKNIKESVKDILISLKTN